MPDVDHSAMTVKGPRDEPVASMLRRFHAAEHGAITSISPPTARNNRAAVETLCRHRLPGEPDTVGFLLDAAPQLAERWRATTGGSFNTAGTYESRVRRAVFEFLEARHNEAVEGQLSLNIGGVDRKPMARAGVRATAAARSGEPARLAGPGDGTPRRLTFDLPGGRPVELLIPGDLTDEEEEEVVALITAFVERINHRPRRRAVG